MSVEKTRSGQEMAAMQTITIPAHFDGERIQLDEPYTLKTDTKLLVTVLQDLSPTADQESWGDLAFGGLVAAYGLDEPEYSLDLIRKPNLEYAGGK